MTCRRLHSGPPLIAAWHRLWCPECRAGRRADAIVARGIAALRDEPVPDAGARRTMELLDLQPVERRVPRWTPGTQRRMATGAVAVVVMLLLWAGLTLSQPPEMRALARTMAAIERVRSIHSVGVSRVKGQMVRDEMWYSEGRSRAEQGDGVTLDDGETRRTYRKGTDFVLVDRSYLKRGRKSPTPFDPGGLLPSLERFRRAGDWTVRVEEQAATDEDGRPLQRFEIYLAHYGSEQKSIWLIDPETRLPVRWEHYDKQQDKWQLSHRLDRIEYNLPIPDRVFRLSLPPGVRVIDRDKSKRARARFAARKLPGGREVILRAIDVTQKGDVLVSVSALEPDGKPMDSIGIGLEKLTDERGTSYLDTGPNIFEGAYRVFWMIPLKPPVPGAPLPRRLTLSVLLGTRERAVFRDLPAPPAVYQTIEEVPPFCDWHDREPEFEQQRRRARIAQQERRMRPLIVPR